ncbi:MAG: NADPH:quinone oxidoreductase family protein [Actinomycetota bacterium]|nr:NADPH:quinone oxidoreductase family protein [Actinomycetota bacterium]
MKAWRAHELGEPEDVLRLDDVDQPEPGPGEVAVRVEACGLNFPDVLLLKGQYQVKPPLPITPGLEVSGVVEAVGDGAALDVGARVLALPTTPHGGLAERVVVARAAAFPVPESMTFEEAASLHITYQTSHVALHRRAALRPGETLLVHAGAGGVGSAAIQLGLAAGARVLATAGGPEKVDVCRRLGAEVAIDYTSEDFVDVVKGATGGKGADVIYDPVGGDVFDRSRRCVAWEGRILVIGFTGGRIADAPTNHILLKNYAVVGVHWGMYATMEPTLMARTHADLLRLHGEGAIAPLVGRAVAMGEAPAALRALADRKTVGKVVVRPTQR